MSLKKRSNNDNSTAPKAKRIKFDKDGKSGDAASPKAAKAAKATTIAKVSAGEEIDFPRGGGTNLSAIEYKALREEANRELQDELFQSKTQSKTYGPRTSKNKSKSLLDKNSLPLIEADDATVPAHRLTYKNLAVGTKILCRIIAIKPLALVVSLPGQLVGHIPLLNISPIYSARLDTSAAADDTAMDEDEDELPELSDIFRVGEYLRAIVIHVHPPGVKSELGVTPKTDEERLCGRVELSVNPTLVNEGLAKADLVAGLTLSATVKTVEDHGYTLDLGVPDIAGFLKFSSSDSDAAEKNLPVGMVIQCAIVSMSKNGRICTVSADPKAIKNAVLPASSSIASILPGTLVTGLITDVTPSGLNVQVLGLFQATVNAFHLPRSSSPSSSSNLKLGKKVQGRVIYTVPSTDPVSFSLSLLPHLTQLSRPSFDEAGGAESQSLEEAFPVGTRLDSVKITQVYKGWGLACEVASGVMGFVPVKRITDHEITLSETTGPWKLLSTHPARVLAISPLDGVLVLTLQEDLIGQAVISAADVQVGQVLKVTVKKLTPTHMVVSLSERVTGIVFPLHYSDVVLKHPERKFQEGKVVKARVNYVDVESSSIRLTLKRTLVESEYPFVGRLEDASVGQVLHGTVSKLLDKAILVEYGGDVRAYIGMSELSDEPVLSVSTSFHVGQVVKTRIIRIELDQRKVWASIRQALTSFEPPPSPSPNAKKPKPRIPKVGDVLDAVTVVKPAKEPAVRTELDYQGTKAYLFPSDTSDDYSSSSSTSSSSASAVHFPDAGTTVKAVVVGVKKRFIEISTRPSRLLPASNLAVKDREITSFDELKEGDVVRGFVMDVKDGRCHVSIGRRITATVPRKEMGDEGVELKWGQVVKGTIVSVEHSQVTMTFRSLEEYKKSKVAHARLDDFSIGDQVDAVVSKVDDAGLWLRIDGTGISGLCRQREVARSRKVNVGSALEGLQPGDHVKAWILKVDGEKKQIGFTLRRSRFADVDGGPDVSTRELAEDDESGEEDGGGEGVEPETVEMDEDEVGGAGSNGSDDDGVLDANAMADSGSKPPPSLPTSTSTKLSLKLGGFNWSGQPEDEDVAMASNDDSDSDSEAGPSTISQRPKNKSKSSIQQDLTLQMHTKTPESSTEFERHLKASPNSSFLWIQFMAFQLQLSETDKAREIGRRALQIINYREEQEKMNVWLALLNLEIAYGTEESLNAVFSEAVRANDAKTIHLRLASLLDEAGRHEQAEEAFRRTTKKFGTSSKVWTLFGEYYLRQGKLDDARLLLPRSLKSLERRKHLKTICKFAQLEYKLGEPERGKTIFEGIIASHPKHLDMWVIYIDQEAKLGNVDSIRSIFNRLFNQKLSSKKAKFFFKKWLALERSMGTEEGAEAVKEKAIAWTEQNAGADE